MLKKLLFPALLLFASSLTGQQTDFNSVVQPIEFKAKDFGEYLVQLTWLNNPESAVAQSEVELAKAQKAVVKKDWMKDFQITLNLNEANLAPAPDLPNFLYKVGGVAILDNNGQKIPLASVVYDEKGTAIPLNTAGGSAFYPRFNAGLNINLGNLVSQSSKNRVKQAEIKIAEHKVNAAKLKLRAEVLSRLVKYKLAQEILKSRTQAEQDTRANFLVVSEQYKKDEETFVHYNEANITYREAVESRIKAETEVQLARVAIEEMIGLKWEQVQHPLKD